MKKFLSGFAVVIVVLFGMVVRVMPVYAANPITLSPSSASLNEGQSRTISINLDQAISPSNATITVSFSSSNPGTVSFSPASVSFTQADWNVTKTTTVTALTNGTYGDTHNELLMATASSTSAHYNKYTGGASLQITDQTAVPGSSAPQDPPPAEDEDDPAEPDQTVQDPDTTVYIAPETKPSSGLTVVTPSTRKMNGTIRYTLSSDGTVSVIEQSGRSRGLLVQISPTESTGMQKLGSYLVLGTLAAAGLLLPVLYVRRNKWQRRQKAKHMRWMERHAGKPAKTTKKRVKRTKR